MKLKLLAVLTSLLMLSTSCAPVVCQVNPLPPTPTVQSAHPCISDGAEGWVCITPEDVVDIRLWMNDAIRTVDSARVCTGSK